MVELDAVAAKAVYPSQTRSCLCASLALNCLFLSIWMNLPKCDQPLVVVMKFVGNDWTKFAPIIFNVISHWCVHFTACLRQDLSKSSVDLVSHWENVVLWSSVCACISSFQKCILKFYKTVFNIVRNYYFDMCVYTNTYTCDDHLTVDWLTLICFNNVGCVCAQ